MARKPRGGTPQEITEEIPSKSFSPLGRTLPGQADQGPPPSASLRADPLTELAAGGRETWLLPYLRTVPDYIDDLTRDFGSDLYERMLLDAEVSANVETIKLGVLSNGIRVTNPRQKGEDGFERAQEICDFISRALESTQKPLLSDLYDMLNAVALGNKIAEQVYKVPKRGRLSNNLILSRLKVKPRQVATTVIDAFYNVRGVAALIPGVPSPIMAGSILLTPPPPNILPRKKFAILTYRERDSDPRGWSVLRAAYTPWYFKVNVWPEMMKHLVQFAGGKQAAILPEAGDDIVDALDPETGAPLTDGTGGRVAATVAQNVGSVLSRFSTGTWATFPYQTELLSLFPPAGSMNPYADAVEIFDRQISKAILHQTLATQEGKHQARAAASVHQDILGQLIQYAKSSVEAMLFQDVFKPLVEYNFGEDEAEDLCPRASLSETEQHDFAEEGEAVSKMYAVGMILPSQLPEIYARLSLPEASKDELDALAERVNNPPEPTAPGGNGDNPPKSGDGKKPTPKDSANFGDDVVWRMIGGHPVPIEGDEAGAESGAAKGGTPAQEPLSKKSRSEIAKASARVTDKVIQRYSEEHNEPALAKGLGGKSMPDNEPVDVELRDGSGNLTHGIELKTMTGNTSGQISMKKDAIERKQEWVKKNGVPIHTVVFDDKKVFNANGDGKHGDPNDRVMYYRRGFAAFRVNAMYQVRDMDELKSLIAMPDADLPKKARR